MGKILRRLFGLAPKTKEEAIWRCNIEYLKTLRTRNLAKRKFDRTSDKSAGRIYLDAKQKAEFYRKELSRLKKQKL